jgi:hypothetical protein
MTVPMSATSKREWTIAFATLLLWLFVFATGVAYLTGYFSGYTGQLPGGPSGHLQFLLPNVSRKDVGMAITILYLGISLYAWRCRFVALYGLAEIALGLFIAFHVYAQITGHASQLANGAFTAAGALYIVVRGFDNIYRALRPSRRLTRAWNVLFFGKDTDGKL